LFSALIKFDRPIGKVASPKSYCSVFVTNDDVYLSAADRFRQMSFLACGSAAGNAFTPIIISYLIKDFPGQTSIANKKMS